MDKFNIKSTSWILFILSLGSVIFIGIFISSKLFPIYTNSIAAIASFITIYFVSINISNFISTSSIEIILNENGLNLKWSKKYIFKSNAEMIIDWSDILKYKYQPDPHFDLFKLSLRNSKTIRIWHGSLVTDDFNKFVVAFESKVMIHNSATTSESVNIISRSKTIFETKLGLFLAIVVLFFLIAFPIIEYYQPKNSGIRWTQIWLAYAGGIFFIGKVIKYRRK